MPSFEQIAETARQVDAFSRSATTSILGSRSPRPSEQGSITMSRRQATVVAIASDSVTINLGESVINDVAYLSTYIPLVNDVVFVEFAGSDPIVVGPVYTAGNTPKERRAAVGSVLRNADYTPANVAIPWTGVSYDPHGMWNSGANTRLTVPAGMGGVWTFGANVPCNLPSTVAANVHLEVRIDSGAIIAADHITVESVSTGGIRLIAFTSRPLPLNAGQYAEIYAFRSLGTETISGGFYINPHFWATRMAAG